MILLDTNVISELMKTMPDPQVLDWVDSYTQDDLFVSAITKPKSCSASLCCLPASAGRS
jgi:hypothetical protein